MRKLAVLSAALIVGILPASAAPPGPSTLTRDGALINAFAVMCMLESPNFSHLEAKATAMRMQPGNSTVSPGTENTKIRHKEFLSTLNTGPFVLILDEMSGSKGVVTACAIGGAVADVDVFRPEFLQAMSLPATPSATMEAEGTRSLVWDNTNGAGTSIILRDFKPGGTSQVLMKYLAR